MYSDPEYLNHSDLECLASHFPTITVLYVILQDLQVKNCKPLFAVAREMVVKLLLNEEWIPESESLFCLEERLLSLQTLRLSHQLLVKSILGLSVKCMTRITTGCTIFTI